MLLNQSIEKPSEALLNDTQLELEISSKSTFIDERDQILSTLLLDNYLSQKYQFTKINSLLALIINNEGVVFNLFYPANDRTKTSEFLFMNAIIENDLKIHYKTPIKNIFKPNSDPVRDEWVIPVFRNLANLDVAKGFGTQVYVINESLIHEKYKDNSLLDNGVIYVVDTNGIIISHPDASHIGKYAQIHKSGTFVDDKFYVTKPCNNAQWLTVAEISQENIYTLLRQVVIRYSLIVLVVVLIACSFVILLSNKITKPLNELMISINKASQKDFSQLIQPKGPKDLVLLINDYNMLLGNIDYLVNKELEQRTQRQKAELDALVAQINPHFLYNTLESIVWQARSVGAEKISNMAYCLGKLFNIAVSNGRTLIEIKNELEHVKKYVELQNIRYNNTIELKVSLDDESLLQELTLKLILQPFVENAILHTGKMEKLIIYIHVEKIEDNIYYFIEDNGAGIKENVLTRINQQLSNSKIIYDDKTSSDNQQKGKGIGIVNVSQRIKLYYGEKYGIRIDRNTNNNGTCVTICIKAQPKNDNIQE